MTTGGAVTARTDGDQHVHAALDGDDHCMCGAPVSERLPQAFSARAPAVCVMCALAEAVRQSTRQANAAANAKAAAVPRGRSLGYRPRRA